MCRVTIDELRDQVAAYLRGGQQGVVILEVGDRVINLPFDRSRGIEFLDPFLRKFAAELGNPERLRASVLMRANTAMGKAAVAAVTVSASDVVIARTDQTTETIRRHPTWFETFCTIAVRNPDARAMVAEIFAARDGELAKWGGSRAGRVWVQLCTGLAICWHLGLFKALSSVMKLVERVFTRRA